MPLCVVLGNLKSLSFIILGHFILLTGHSILQYTIFWSLASSWQAVDEVASQMEDPFELIPVDDIVSTYERDINRWETAYKPYLQYQFYIRKHDHILGEALRATLVADIQTHINFPIWIFFRVAKELRLIQEATVTADARLLASGIDPSSWPESLNELLLSGKECSPASELPIASESCHVVSMAAEDVFRLRTKSMQRGKHWSKGWGFNKTLNSFSFWNWYPQTTHRIRFTWQIIRQQHWYAR